MLYPLAYGLPEYREGGWSGELELEKAGGLLVGERFIDPQVEHTKPVFPVPQFILGASAALPQWIDADDAMDGQAVTIVGRALNEATVLVGGVQAPLLASHYGYARFTMPAGLSGPQTVTANGTAAGMINAVGPVTDPLGIGKAFAANILPFLAGVVNVKDHGAVGNGAADDTAAIQSVCNLVNAAGGGTVYLPAGSYKIDTGTPLSIFPNTVVLGEGKSLSRLKVGARYGPSDVPNSGDYAIACRGSRIVLADFGIDNLSQASGMNGIIRGAYSSDVDNTNAQNAWLRLDVQQGNGRAPTLVKPDDFVMRGCEGLATGNESGLSIIDADRVSIESNHLTHSANRLRATFCNRAVVWNNTFDILAAPYNANSSLETGGLETSFTTRILVAKSALGFDVPVTSSASGELLGTQRSIVADFHGQYPVASCSGTSMTVGGSWTGQAWLYAPKPQRARHTVKVLTGAGEKQVRCITAHDDANGLTIDRPWDVKPAPGDIVSIVAENCYLHTYVENEFRNGSAAVSIYSGALSPTVVGNKAFNSGHFILRAPNTYRGSVGTQNEGMEFATVWDAVFANEATNDNGARPAGTTLFGATFSTQDDENAGIVRPDFPLLINDVRLSAKVNGLNQSVMGEIANVDGVIVKIIRYDGATPPPDRATGVVLGPLSLTGAVLNASTVNFSQAPQ